MSPWYAMAFAPLVQPWGLIAVGAATLVEANPSSWMSYLGLVYFCLLSSTPYLTMVILATIRPHETQAFFDPIAYLDQQPRRPAHHLALTHSRPLACR